MGRAEGVVLETAIGHNLNIGHYEFAKIKKLFGCDWVEASLQEGCKRGPEKDVTLFNCDMHKMPFSDGSFDTIVDTFGLECSYDLDRSYAEMKRLVKPGGKILLLERGKGFWLFDNFRQMVRCSVNMSARAQFYHHDFSELVENDPEIKVLKAKRKRRGMIYYYELQKI